MSLPRRIRKAREGRKNLATPAFRVRPALALAVTGAILGGPSLWPGVPGAPVWPGPTPTRLAAQASPERVDSATESAATEAHRIFPLPFLFYQPETGLGGGAGVLHTFRGGPRVSTDQLFLVVTAKRQYSAAVATERYPGAGRWMLAGQLAGSRFPDLFYGVGNRTRSAAEESYTLDRAGGEIAIRRRLTRDLFVGPAVALLWSDPHGFEEGGLLEAGIPGSMGGTVVGAGASLLLDRRDHTLTPTSGVYLAGLARVHAPATGSDFRFTRYEVDGRAYRTVRPGHVLAAQAVATAQTGEPPFFELARLGGAAILRGSYDGRYRDRNRLFGQAEYRLGLRGRLGAAVFVGAGQVARDWDDFRLDGIHVAGGAGLRILVAREENVNVRVDFGVADGETGLYFGFAEAF